MVVAFTGHRPNKVGGYTTPNPKHLWICWRIAEELESLKPSLVISGMALGVDQWAAQIAVDMHIPFVAAIPFAGQELAWPHASQKEFRRLKQLASEEVIVCSGEYSASKMQKRNEYMVDRCEVLIAVWDGTPGGTGNCVKYAQKLKKTIIRIIP